MFLSNVNLAEVVSHDFHCVYEVNFDLRSDPSAVTLVQF